MLLNERVVILIKNVATMFLFRFYLSKFSTVTDINPDNILCALHYETWSGLFGTKATNRKYSIV